MNVNYAVILFLLNNFQVSYTVYDIRETRKGLFLKE